MNDDRAIFLAERRERIENYQHDRSLLEASRQFMSETLRAKYSYQFDWLGLPIIQYPQDIVAMQELIWSVQPDLIIETGIARGGSLMFSASMLALLDLTESMSEYRPCDSRRSKRRVIGVDLDIRPHNRAVIEQHPLTSYIYMIEGSSIDLSVINQIRSLANDHQKIMVCLDSNHTHEHVLAELEAYAPLVDIDSYCIVFDTLIEDFPSVTCAKRPWSQGNSPKTAVQQFLMTHSEFQIDPSIHDKLLITAAGDGFLRRLT